MLQVKCVLLLFCYHQLLGGAVSEFTPTVYTITSSSSCGQYDPMQDEQLMEALQQAVEQLPVKQSAYSSCKSIHNANPSAASGYYQINATNGSLVQVYCDMEGTNCGGLSTLSNGSSTTSSSTISQSESDSSLNRLTG